MPPEAPRAAVVAFCVLMAGCASVEQAPPGCAVFQGYVFEATVMSAGFTIETDEGATVGPLFPAHREAWNQTRAALMDGSHIKVVACDDADGRSVYERVEVTTQ